MSALAHDELRDLTGLYVLGAMTAEERAAFELHLKQCDECAAEVRSLLPVAHGLAQAVPDRAPSPDLRRRIVPASPIPSPAPVATFERPVRAPARPSSAGWLAAAAAIVLAVGAIWYAWTLQQRVERLESRLDDASSRAATAERVGADATRIANDAQRAAAILTAADLARVELAGQTIAPTAHARAFWSRSRGLLFTASSLPPLPPGKIYQLWVVTPNAPVSAGLFAPDQDGQARIVADTPAGVTTAVAMAVTIEQAGGVPAPTGEKYLVGTPTTPS